MAMTVNEAVQTILENTDLSEHIVVSSEGIPVFRDSQAPVYVILDMLSDGFYPDEIRNECPGIEEEHISAALRFASEILFYAGA